MLNELFVKHGAWPLVTIGVVLGIPVGALMFAALVAFSGVTVLP